MTPQDEARDPRETLNNLYDCYADDLDSPSVKRSLKDYSPSIEDSNRKCRLSTLITDLIDRIIDENPHCPRWASQAVDRLDHENQRLNNSEDR